MDSPLSPIIVDLVMRDLEERALGRLGVRVPFYFRYVDDITMAIPSSVCDTILEAFKAMLAASVLPAEHNNFCNKLSL